MRATCTPATACRRRNRRVAACRSGGAAAVEQDRPSDAVADCAVDRARDGGWHPYEHDLVALADDSQHSMAVLFTEVGDVHAGCFGDPQPKEAEQADEASRPP
jgi:hypothetical protein